MKKVIGMMLIGIFAMGTGWLYAAEQNAQAGVLRQIADVQGRGLVNIFTCWGEMIRAQGLQKEAHPKAWPLTYFPYAFGNTLLRLGSGIHDAAILPFYVGVTKDSTPITERMDLPEYYWKKN